MTRDEYLRFFEPVLDLSPSERHAELERAMPQLEDVPEIWVSRDDRGDACQASLMWREKPHKSNGGNFYGEGGRPLPKDVAKTLTPGECRRITAEEYHRFRSFWQDKLGL